MYRLHGFASSNYHNVVKLALIEKAVAFEEMTAYPPADEAYASKNPTGKYPCLELDDGSFLGESKVILNYLEEAFHDIPLLPIDPLERARVRELMELIDLYLELPARRLYPEALFQGSVSDEAKEGARFDLALKQAKIARLSAHENRRKCHSRWAHDSRSRLLREFTPVAVPKGRSPESCAVE